jgi:hypothetical protein
MITAGVAIIPLMLIQVRTEGSSMETLGQSGPHEHRLGGLWPASDM